MKYCPDCDMEFIDSVQTCTDCGKVLVDKDKYLEGKAAREQQAQQELLEKRQQMMEQMEKLAEEEKDERPARPEPTVYVTRAERYEDLKSSASAFWIVGGALTILAIAGWAGMVPVNIMMKFMFTVLAAGSLFIAWKTTNDAKTVKGQIKEESEVTAQLIDWFLNSYSAENIDETVRRENGDLQNEVLVLKRFNFIQDTFITHYDLADQGYVDALAEDVYSRLYEEEVDEEEFEEEEFEEEVFETGGEEFHEEVPDPDETAEKAEAEADAEAETEAEAAAEPADEAEAAAETAAAGDAEKADPAAGAEGSAEDSDK